MSRHVLRSAGLLCALSIAGCADKASPPTSIDGGDEANAAADSGYLPPVETFPQVISEEVEYYTSSPAQGRPPDGKLAAGTKVRVRRNTGSYALVKTADGIEAYVHSDAVQEPGAEATP